MQNKVISSPINANKSTKRGRMALDTKAQLTPKAQVCAAGSTPSDASPVPAERYLKRAKRKFLGDEIKRGLSRLSTSELQSSYYGSLLCSSELKADFEGVTSRYCNQRWCPVCGAIRTAKNITNYFGQMQQLAKAENLNWYMVTLTRPNVDASLLPAEIDHYFNWWRSYTKSQQKPIKAGFRAPLDGVRKFECTYNVTRKDYHPHYHILVLGEVSAKHLHTEWLRLNPTAKEKAQDCRPVGENERDFIEVFKYSTKLSSKGGKSSHSLNFNMLDVIFTNMRGRRIYQPFGRVKQMENTDEKMTLEKQALKSLVHWSAKWIASDWYFTQVAELDQHGKPIALPAEISEGFPLTNYHPDESTLKLSEWINSAADKTTDLQSSDVVQLLTAKESYRKKQNTITTEATNKAKHKAQQFAATKKRTKQSKIDFPLLQADLFKKHTLTPHIKPEMAAKYWSEKQRNTKPVIPKARTPKAHTKKTVIEQHLAK